MKMKPALLPKAMLLALFAVVSIIAYFINVGFDINDEGFYFLGYNRKQDIFFSSTGFHFLVRWFPYSDGVILNRIYRLLLHLIGSFILFKAVFLYFKLNRNKWVGFCWIFLGSLASYVYAPNSLGYNTLNLFLLELIVSAFLYFLLANADRKESTWWGVGLIILVSLLFFNKASSAVLLIGVFILYYLTSVSGSFKKKVLNVFIFGTAVFSLSVIWFWLSFGQNIITFYQEIGNDRLLGVSDYQGLVYHLKQLFFNPFYQSKKQLVFVSFFIIVFFLERKFKAKWTAATGLADLFYCLISVCLFIYYLKYYACGSGAEIFTSLLLFFFIVAAFKREEWTVRHARVLFLIFCLPMIGFVGSNVSPFEGMNHYLVFYFVLIFLIGHQLNFLFIKWFYFLAAVFIVFRFVNFPFENPPLHTLTYKVKLNDESNVLIVKDEVGKELLAFNGFIEKANLSSQVAYINVAPGILFLASKVNYGTIYYNSNGGLNYYLNFLLNGDASSDIDYVVKSAEGDSFRTAIWDSFLKEKRKDGFLPDTLLMNASYSKIRFVSSVK